MFYYKWDEEKYKDLSEDGIHFLVIEVDENGMVTREIGFDINNRIAHRCPSDRYKYGEYGFFDLAKIDTSVESHMTEEEFDNLWNLIH